MKRSTKSCSKPSKRPSTGENGGFRTNSINANSCEKRFRRNCSNWKDKDEDHLQPKDEDARVMKCRSGNKFAYNAQAVVDEQSKLIVAADVVTDESDNYQLVPMLEEVKENVGQVAEQTVADAGYVATTEFARAEEKQFSVVVNLPKAVQ